MVYHAVLLETEPERKLYLAVPNTVVVNIFQEPLGALLLSKYSVQLLGFNPLSEELVQWIPPID